MGFTGHAIRCLQGRRGADAMKMAILHVPVVIVTLILSSCTVTFPQFEQVFDRNNNVFVGQKAVANEWLVQANSGGVVMLPYKESGLTIFVNARTGDAVSFDGWTIRSIVGFFGETPTSLYRADGKLVISRGEAPEIVSCNNYERFTSASLGKVIWRQGCERGKFVNEIEVNNEGEIVLITQYAGFGEFIKLERY